MTGRSHITENTKKQPVLPTPAQGMFQSRPFVVQPQTEERSEQPDLKTALQRAERYGHRLDRIKSIKPPVQAKLTIGQSGDRYEQEADRVAAQVVNSFHAPTTQRQEEPDKELQAKPEITALQLQEEPDEELQAKPSILDQQRSPLPPEVQREAKSEEEELQAQSNLQRQEAIGGEEALTDVESAINRAKDGGHPLEVDLQRSMGQAMGADFSRVKVHTEAEADQLNQSIQARAFTTGQDVFFRQGADRPGSRGGQELIAHELTHVVQQNGGAVQQSPQPQAQLQQHHLIQRVPQHGADPSSSYANVEPEQTFYRGGSQFQAKPNEVKIDRRTGFVKTTHGISVHLAPNKIRRFGGAYKILNLPNTLKIIQRGRDPQHYEIVPREANLTFEQFNEELGKIQATKEE